MGKKKDSDDRILYIRDAMEYSREGMGKLLEEVMFIEGMNFECKTLDCQ